MYNDTRDVVGDLMKVRERCYRPFLEAGGWLVVRCDGRSFSRWTSKLTKPFDVGLMDHMDAVMRALVEDVDGAVLGYTQSDEISVVAPARCDGNHSWFGGNVVKQVGSAAAVTSSTFARLRSNDERRATFDARVFRLEDLDEVVAYLQWRQADARRNAVSMIAQQHYSPRQLHKVGTQQRHQLIEAAGDPVDGHPSGAVHGRVLRRRVTVESVTYIHKKSGEQVTVPAVERTRWVCETAPDFTRDTVLELVGSTAPGVPDHSCSLA